MLSLDKENATGVPRGTAKQVVDTVSGVPVLSAASVGASNQQSNGAGAMFATPKNSFKKLVLTNSNITTTGNNTTGKRRPALCDVTLNTANRAAMLGVTPNHQMGITPKFDRKSSLVPRALGDYTKPTSYTVCGGTGVKRITDATPKVLSSVVDDDIEPVERFIGSKYDSFDDLFPDGRLSEMFLGKKMTFVAKLPNGNHEETSEVALSPIREFTEIQRDFSPMKSNFIEPELAELELPPLDEYDCDDTDSLVDLLVDVTM